MRESRTLLDEALEARIPGSKGWPRREWPPTDPSPEGPTYLIDVPAPVEPEARRLEIELRADGDVDVRFHLPERKGGPFEAHFVVWENPDEGMVAVAGFVADLIEERLILGWDRSFFRGGRVFFAPEELEPRRRKLSWTASWRATYDWVGD